MAVESKTTFQVQSAAPAPPSKNSWIRLQPSKFAWAPAAAPQPWLLLSKYAKQALGYPSRALRFAWARRTTDPEPSIPHKIVIRSKEGSSTDTLLHIKLAKLSQTKPSSAVSTDMNFHFSATQIRYLSDMPAVPGSIIFLHTKRAEKRLLMVNRPSTLYTCISQGRRHATLLKLNHLFHILITGCSKCANGHKRTVQRFWPKFLH